MKEFFLVTVLVVIAVSLRIGVYLPRLHREGLVAAKNGARPGKRED
jgi:hypothetical protein